MKAILLGLCGTLLCFTAAARQKQHDPVAILVIDRMADLMGEMESCSFRLHTARDIPDTKAQHIKEYTQYEVYFSGNDKMLVNAHGPRGHRQYRYNGSELAHYDSQENNYGILTVPNRTIAMIDTISRLYQVDFPAADFFYPSFTDDLLAHADLLQFMGMVKLDGQDCFHILAVNKEMVIQYWIANDAFHLPVRFAITYLAQPGQPQYEGHFSQWAVNPSLPVTLFDFQPPPGSALVRLFSVYDR